MKSYALSGTSAAPPEKKPADQDLSRHTPKAAANHLSALEQAQHDARNVERDAAALARVHAARLPKPPHRHIFISGSCKVCAMPEGLL